MIKLDSETGNQFLIHLFSSCFLFLIIFRGEALSDISVQLFICTTRNCCTVRGGNISNYKRGKKTISKVKNIV